VVADLNGAGQVVRSYIYAGRDLVAVKDQIGLAWNHSDPVTKSKRWTNQCEGILGREPKKSIPAGLEAIS
jgi:hypothetical protein